MKDLVNIYMNFLHFPEMPIKMCAALAKFLLPSQIDGFQVETSAI